MYLKNIFQIHYTIAYFLQSKHRLRENDNNHHQRKHTVMIDSSYFLLFFTHKAVHDKRCAEEHRYHNKS